MGWRRSPSYLGCEYRPGKEGGGLVARNIALEARLRVLRLRKRAPQLPSARATSLRPHPPHGPPSLWPRRHITPILATLLERQAAGGRRVSAVARAGGRPAALCGQRQRSCRPHDGRRHLLRPDCGDVQQRLPVPRSGRWERRGRKPALSRWRHTRAGGPVPRRRRHAGGWVGRVAGHFERLLRAQHVSHAPHSSIRPISSPGRALPRGAFAISSCAGAPTRAQWRLGRRTGTRAPPAMRARVRLTPPRQEAPCAPRAATWRRAT